VKKIKSLLYSLYTLSGVTSEPRCLSPRICAKVHTSGCNGSVSLAMCEKLYRLGIWNRGYL